MTQIRVINDYQPVTKFRFTDHQLAIKTRNKMRQHVQRFDINNNKKFQQNEIKKLLVSLLGQDINQVSYVVKNVFRYDRNNDGWVTYQQFINFSVEQHFGEMAIQRLHRNGRLYSKGNQRIMNSQQFCKTLAYCLQSIQSSGNLMNYQQLFRQVDLDRDGWISYSDYFLFLRQYFGANSYAASLDNLKVQQIKNPQFIDGNNQSAQQRIAKLVYSQLKILVMLQDRQKKICLQRIQVDRVMQNIFGLNGYQKDQIIKRVLGQVLKISYESFMIQIVPYFLSQVIIQKQYPNLSRIQNGSFILMFNKFLSFVSIKPADHILNKIFERADQNRDGFISVEQYKQMINFIFRNYQFDRRGIPRNKRSNIYDNQQ